MGAMHKCPKPTVMILGIGRSWRSVTCPYRVQTNPGSRHSRQRGMRLFDAVWTPLFLPFPFLELDQCNRRSSIKAGALQALCCRTRVAVIAGLAVGGGIQRRIVRPSVGYMGVVGMDCIGHPRAYPTVCANVTNCMSESFSTRASLAWSTAPRKTVASPSEAQYR